MATSPCVHGVVYCEDEVPIEGRLSVELSDSVGQMLSGTMTEPDGSFLLTLSPAWINTLEHVTLTVWRGKVRLRRLTLPLAEALSRGVWIPVEEVTAMVKIRGTLRTSDGAPAAGHRVCVRRVIAWQDGRLMKVKVGEGRTGPGGAFTVACTIPPEYGERSLLLIQAYDGGRQPAVCLIRVVDHRVTRPVELALPEEASTVIMPMVRLRSAG